MGDGKKVIDHLKKNQNIVAVCEAKSCPKAVLNLCSSASDKFKKILLVSFTQPAELLAKKLGEEGIDSSKYIIIDCFPKKHFETGNGNIHLTSPTSLIELASVLNRTFRKEKIKFLLIDNISSILLYNDETKVMQFLHSLITQLHKKDTKSVYLFAREKRKDLLADISMFADAIMSI